MQWRQKTRTDKKAVRTAHGKSADGSPPRDKKDKPARERKKLSRLHKPPGMSLEDWQIELRRQFGLEQNFRLKNVGEHPLFSAFEVTNPQSKNTYRVQVRGARVGDNFCSCPDFATNTLGTCKHIEFTLAAIERKRGGAARLKAGFQSSYSEIRSRSLKAALRAPRGKVSPTRRRRCSASRSSGPSRSASARKSSKRANASGSSTPSGPK